MGYFIAYSYNSQPPILSIFEPCMNNFTDFFLNKKRFERDFCKFS